jgi:hypothetical protein
MSKSKKIYALEINSDDFLGAIRGNPESCPVAHAVSRAGFDDPRIGKYTCSFRTDRATVDRILPKDLREHINKYDQTGKKFAGTFTLLTPKD